MWSEAALPSIGEFEIAGVDAESGEQRFALTDACAVLFEDCRPVWGSLLQGQRNHVGPWWTVTTGSLVGYESWLERARFAGAAWFAQHRCGGDAMLHHRSLAPVILRDWAQPNILFESAISATATVH
ncbi:hypothetical protein ACIBG0_29060 [Nocardia sp. NPDC050630]|uniref:hypothetical protein n=1 Tax=Nocardia sp. NPDC050630 TaxID=3364321 RepID=UPI0037A4FB30